MQGRDSLQSPKALIPTLSRDDKENSAQNISFESYTDLEGPEDSTQLEDLQVLLEISHHNEKLAKQRTAEATKEINALRDELKAMQSNLENLDLALNQEMYELSKEKLATSTLSEQYNEQFKKIEEDDVTIQSLITERDELLSLSNTALERIEHEKNAADSREAKLQLSLSEAHENLKQLESNYEKQLDTLHIKVDAQMNESSKLKKIIHKQHVLLEKKESEITRLIGKAPTVEKNKLYASVAQSENTHFFKAADKKPEIESENKATNRNNPKKL